ncbi:MAG: diguanylate cyclase [Thermodesulfobacteriota bacterium]
MYQVLRVLAVDDDPEILGIYQDTLRLPHGGLLAEVELDVCPQGDQAVELVRRALGESRPYAVIFLDVRLPPGPDGVWTARQIRSLDPRAEILIVTAYSDVNPLEITSEAGPPDKMFYLQKPFHPQEILQFTYALGAKWRAERRLEEANRELERKVRERTAELELANKRLAKLAVTDELTGLYNRRHFYNNLEAEFSRAARYNNPLSLLMIDLDHFKSVNDRFGHHCGDLALQTVAGFLTRNTRHSDLVARFGGEEFTVLLPETDGPTAWRVAENLRRKIEETQNQCQSEVFKITVSVGVASFSEATESAERLLQAADEALYRAKRAGRNRVELWSRPGPGEPPP